MNKIFPALSGIFSKTVEHYTFQMTVNLSTAVAIKQNNRYSNRHTDVQITRDGEYMCKFLFPEISVHYDHRVKSQWGKQSGTSYLIYESLNRLIKIHNY